jgi:hypothetical protein
LELLHISRDDADLQWAAAHSPTPARPYPFQIAMHLLKGNICEYYLSSGSRAGESGRPGDVCAGQLSFVIFSS